MLGFTFVAERHGAGPGALGERCDGGIAVVLELYPAKFLAVDTQAVRLGFTVPNLPGCARAHYGGLQAQSSRLRGLAARLQSRRGRPHGRAWN